MVSTTVRYDTPPLPLHSPQTAPPPRPVPDHGPAVPNALPALREASSGASASTCSTETRTPMAFMHPTVEVATDNASGLHVQGS
ncbi:hypothetical protein GCM10018791_38370 [Streptomyces zaomyceticus]|nr:hypothetical protein GCM10018791_38370 [Streptomyces zaomyceticus]